MLVAYLFTFFLVILIVLFLLVPFLRHDKSIFMPEPTPQTVEEEPQDIPLDLGRDEDGLNESTNLQRRLADYEVEIEIAVRKARRRNNAASKCGQCGHRMQRTDRFCASCGTPVQSS